MTIRISVTNWVTVETDDEDEASAEAMDKIMEDPPAFWDGAVWDTLLVEKERR